MDQLLALCLRARRDPAALTALDARAASGQIDWQALAGRIEAERVGPLLHTVFSQAAFVPSAVATLCEESTRATTLRYVVWSSALERISGALAGENIPFIVLKGAALAETIYDRPSLRPLADIDILVPRDRVAAVLDVLQAMGYLPPRAAESESYTLHFENELALSPRNPIGAAIDIHWSLLDSPYYQRELSHDWFWTSSMPFAGYAGAHILGPEAQLLHLSAHLMVHHHGKGVLWLYDIVELLHRYRGILDWDQTFEQAQRCDLVLSLQRTLGRTIDELGGEVDAGRRAQLSRLPASAEERHVFEHPTIGTELAEHFWNDVLTLPNWRSRVAYVAQRVVPSAAFMRQRYQTDTTWLAPYYPYRWLLGAWQILCLVGARLARRGRHDTNGAFPARGNDD